MTPQIHQIKKIKTLTEDIIDSQWLACIDKIIKTVNVNLSPSQEVQNAAFNLQLEMDRMSNMQKKIE